MNKWKVSFFISLVALFISNGFWLFVIIDNGVTYTYQQVSLEDKEKSVKFLSALIVKGGQKYSKKDILHILRQADKNAFIAEEENSIFIDNIRFNFNNDRLIEVEG